MWPDPSEPRATLERGWRRLNERLLNEGAPVVAFFAQEAERARQPGPLDAAGGGLGGGIFNGNIGYCTSPAIRVDSTWRSCCYDDDLAEVGRFAVYHHVNVESGAQPLVPAPYQASHGFNFNYREEYPEPGRSPSEWVLARLLEELRAEGFTQLGACPYALGFGHGFEEIVAHPGDLGGEVRRWEITGSRDRVLGQCFAQTSIEDPSVVLVSRVFFGADRLPEVQRYRPVNTDPFRSVSAFLEAMAKLGWGCQESVLFICDLHCPL